MKKNNTITEFPFKAIASRYYMPWLIALLFFLLTILLSVMTSFGGFLSDWQKSFNNTISIELPLPPTNTAKTHGEVFVKAQKALQTLKGFKKATIIPQSQMQKLLEPWLGKVDNLDALNLPLLIDAEFDVRITPNKQATLDALRSFSPNVRIENIGDWHSHMHQNTLLLKILAFTLTGCIIIAIFVAIMLITRSVLVAHQSIINLLRLMGAKYSYIAHQFQLQAFWVCIKSSLMGFSILVPFILILGWLSYSFNALQTYRAVFSLNFLLVLIAIPFIIALISSFITRLTVLKFLKKHNA